MSLNFTPLFNRVVIKQAKAGDQSKGGIYIPSKAQEKPIEGDVVAVGPGKTLENGSFLKTAVDVGDRVIYAKFGGTDLKIGDDEYIILEDVAIYGILS